MDFVGFLSMISYEILGTAIMTMYETIRIMNMAINIQLNIM